MEPFRPSAAGLEASRKFVHYNYLAAPYHVLLVATEKCFGAHGRLQMVDVFYAALGVNVLYTEQLFGLGYACVGHCYGAALFVHGIIFFRLESCRNASECAVKILRLACRRGDDKWGACLVYQNGVYFVHDCEVMSSLPELLL